MAYRPLFLLAAVALALVSRSARADAASGETTRREKLTLDAALARFHAKSFDLRAAEALVAGAEGDRVAAGQVENPLALLSVTHVFNYRDDGQAPVLGPCITCADTGPNIGINDSAALIHTLTGERAARVRAATAALRAARLQRDDAKRALDFQLKSQYVQVLAAQAALTFSREIDDFAQRMTTLGRARHPGAIDDGELARLEAEGLRADLAVVAAQAALDGETAALAFLLDDREPTTSYTLDEDALKLAVPRRLTNVDVAALTRSAIDRRPDLRASSALVEQLQGAVSLAKYQLIPDVQLYALYVEQGVAQNTATPPMVTFGIQTTLPIFYQQQGEIRRAEANLDNQLALRDRATAQVIQDVRVACSTFLAARRIAETMEAEIFPRAKRGREIAAIRFQEGSTSLLDLFDAQRQYVMITQEYVQDLLGYWNAIFGLEQAVGEDLRP